MSKRKWLFQNNFKNFVFCSKKLNGSLSTILKRMAVWIQFSTFCISLSKMKGRLGTMRAPKWPSFFSQWKTKFYNCTQTVICILHQNKKFRTLPKLPFILWLQNTKFSKLFRKCHRLFDNKLKNLKLHPNCHSLFDYEIRNLRPYLNILLFTLLKTKIEL